MESCRRLLEFQCSLLVLYANIVVAWNMCVEAGRLLHAKELHYFCIRFGLAVSRICGIRFRFKSVSALSTLNRVHSVIVLFPQIFPILLLLLLRVTLDPNTHTFNTWSGI